MRAAPTAQARALLDSSVILASLEPDEPAHDACAGLVGQGGHSLYVHALAETFSILTGGQGARRIDAGVAVELLEESAALCANHQPYREGCDDCAG